MSVSVRVTLLAALLVVVAGCSSAEPEADGPNPAEGSPPLEASRSSSPTESLSPSPSASPSETSTADESAEAPPRPVSMPAYFDRDFRGGGLRLGATRERTEIYTSYDVKYRSEDLTITGVLNVPRGKGPFPAVVLAHGYIDPAIYVRGQGMTRERGYLASRGYVALHVDYRNHAESSDDPNAARNLRLGYAVDVVNAVQALQETDAVPINDDQVFLMGRSMGGGVVYKALEMAPGLAAGAAAWASVSSLEAENYNQFIRGDPADGLDDFVARRYGLPGDPGSARFWREVSSRPYFDRITEPVLNVHGRFDDTCPPRWARATQKAMVAAGVDARSAWYDDGHAFGPAFFAAMDRTIAFFDNVRT